MLLTDTDDDDRGVNEKADVDVIATRPRNAVLKNCMMLIYCFSIVVLLCVYSSKLSFEKTNYK